MKKKITLYIFTISTILLNILLIYNILTTINNKNNYFRLHIVANSNSFDDQIIKLKVSKKVTNYLNELYTSNNNLTNSNDKEVSKDLIKNNITTILNIANNELKSDSANYGCYANIGEIAYDKKLSEFINMDEGIYDSAQIILGKGKGQNFWSLIFPYSYNPNFDIEKDINLDNIEIKSGIFNNIKKVVNLFN